MTLVLTGLSSTVMQYRLINVKDAWTGRLLSKQRPPKREKSATLGPREQSETHMTDKIETRRAAEKFIERFGENAVR